MDKKFIRELGEIMNEIGLDELTFKNSEALITLKKHSQLEQVNLGNQRAAAQNFLAREAGGKPLTDIEIPITDGSDVGENANENRGKEDLDSITANTIGTYYSKPDPNSEVFVNKGDKVKKGQVVCILEAMKLMNEIKAPFNCQIEEILISDGEIVEFGEELFKVKKL